MYKINLVNKTNDFIKHVTNTEPEEFHDILKMLTNSLRASNIENNVTIENNECTIFVNESEKKAQLLFKVIEMIDSYNAWGRVVIFDLNPIEDLNKISRYLENTTNTQVIMLHEKGGFLIINKTDEE